jgi:hypothetical protein
MMGADQTPLGKILSGSVNDIDRLR